MGVGGVVIEAKRVLLIQRGRPPLKGEWSIPGGMVELGETLEESVRREIREETGLIIEPLEVIGAFDRIEKTRSRVRYHYVIVDYLCRRTGGRLKPASDVRDARWVERRNLPKYGVTPLAASVIAEAFRLASTKSMPGRLAAQFRSNRFGGN